MPVVDSWVHLERSKFPTNSIKSKLTVRWQNVNDQQKELECYREEGEFLAVPRDYGFSLLRNVKNVQIAVSEGAPMPKRLAPIVMREGQKEWVQEVVQLFNSNVLDVIAQAGVGKGKTVMSLEIARRLGRVPLVVVDQEFLKQQWIDRAVEFYGVDEKEIGIVQGSTCDYRDKVIVVAMMQSLYQKVYPEEFYRHFGLVVFDEVHTAGAPQFSKVLGMFSAKCRLGISATPDRTDALNKVLRLHLGKVQVRLRQDHKKSMVRIVEYDRALSAYANTSKKSGKYLSELTVDTDRNWMIAEIVLRLYEKGHHILVVSDRIEQLHALLEMCVLQGIEREECGLICGFEYQWIYEKDPFPRLKPDGWDGKALYTPVKLQIKANRMAKHVLEKRKNTKTILFATYSMFSKGVDVPRLSAGIEATPRSKALQVHGRVLRVQTGKLTPIWVTIRDTMSYRAEFQLRNRISEYVINNAELHQWHLEKGTRRLDTEPLLRQLQRRITLLKGAVTLMQKDGSYTLKMPDIGNSSRSEHAGTTAASTPRRKPVWAARRAASS